LRLRFVRVGVTTAAALLQCQCDCWWGGWLLAVGGWLLAVGCWLLRYADTDTLMCAVLVIARPLLLVVVQHSCCWC